MRIEEIETPIYKVMFTVKVYENENEVPVNSDEYPFKDRIGCIYRKDEDITIVLNMYHSLTAGEIAHEAKHLVNEIFISIHAKLDVNNDEFECYLLQWVIDELYRIIYVKD